LENFKNSNPVAQKNIAPHNRIRRRNPGKVPKATGGKFKNFGFNIVFKFGRRADNRISNQVRQM